MTNEAPDQSWTALVKRVNWMRKPENRGAYRGELAALRQGISEFTETRAYPYVLPYVADGSDPTPVLRAVALQAEMVDIPQVEQQPDKPVRLGRSFLYASNMLAATHGGETAQINPDKPDAIASRLQALPALDLESAVRTLRTVLTLVRGTGVGIDFYDLTRTLTRWGNGYTPQSQAVRKRILRDYYGAAAIPADTDAADTQTTKDN